MSPLAAHSSDELIDFIEAAGETANVEAKGPMQWDGGEASAALTKDVLALANTRDGGAIVIGKQESRPSKFDLVGMSEAQASSFDTTKVATWVNNHCSPPVDLACYRQDREGLTFVIIVVSEFHDVPVLCTKPYEAQCTGKKSKSLLRKDTVYVRTSNVESAPLSTVEEMRRLIGLATTKRADQMLAMFQAMLKGQPLLGTKPDDEEFAKEQEAVGLALRSDLADQTEKGAWTFVCHPVHYEQNRWQETDALKTLVERSAVRLRREFPPISRGVHVREWGICNQYYEDAFGLTRSGLFMSARLFKENTVVFKNQWQPNPDIPAGKWIDFKANLSMVVELFAFLSRFAESLEIGEELVYEITAAPLAGRRLVRTDSPMAFEPTDPSRANVFQRKKVVTAEVVRASWEELCAKTLHGFFELFSGIDVSNEVLLDWVNKLVGRAV